MEFIVWLVVAMGGAWCLLSPFKVIAFFQRCFGWMGESTQNNQVAEQPPTEILSKDRSTQARQHRDWDYAFAALQIKQKGTKIN
jgi:hypothetical protein